MCGLSGMAQLRLSTLVALAAMGESPFHRGPDQGGA